MVESTEIDKTTSEIRKLRETIIKKDRLGRAFTRGLVTGIGTAIGATLIAALAIAIFLQLLKATGIDQYLPEGVVKSWNIER